MSECCTEGAADRLVPIFLKYNSYQYIGTFLHLFSVSVNILVPSFAFLAHQYTLARKGDMDTPNLYIYWAHDAGMMSPTLQVARIYLKRRLPIKQATFSTWVSVLRILLMTICALASLTVQTACKGHFALRIEYAAMVLKGLHWGQRRSYTAWPNGFANEDFLCVSPMVPDGVFFGHLQAGRNSTDF